MPNSQNIQRKTRSLQITNSNLPWLKNIYFKLTNAKTMPPVTSASSV